MQVEKRALCAFDTKRFLLDDGFNTLAYGHKDITERVIQDHIRNPGADLVLANKEARELGLVWGRRKGALKRLGYDPAVRNEESDDDALQAGRDMRARMTQMLNRVDEVPDRLLPQEDRPILHRTRTEPIQALRRVRLPSIDEIVSEPEPQPPVPVTQTQVALNLMFPDQFPAPQNQTTIHKHPLTREEQAGIDEFHNIFERVGASSSSNSAAQSTPPIPATRARESETDSGDLPHLLALTRRRPTKKLRRERARAFFLQEAEEGESTDEDAPRSRKRSHHKNIKAPSGISHPRTDSEHESGTESDMSFVVGDDIFE